MSIWYSIPEINRCFEHAMNPVLDIKNSRTRKKKKKKTWYQGETLFSFIMQLEKVKFAFYKTGCLDPKEEHKAS